MSVGILLKLHSTVKMANLTYNSILDTYGYL